MNIAGLMLNKNVQIAFLKAKLIACVPFIWLGTALGFVGSYIILAQIILWMRSGYWIEMPLLYFLIDPWPVITSTVPLAEIAPNLGMLSNPFIVLGVERLIAPTGGLYWETYKYFGVLSEWMSQPQSWLGLHKLIYWILEFIPISLSCFILAATSSGLAVIYKEHFKEEIDKISKQKTSHEK